MVHDKTKLKARGSHLQFDFIRDFYATLNTAYEIIEGTSNPLIHQLTYLKKFLKEDFGQSYNESNFILTGDFNFPKSIKFLNTAGYAHISAGLIDHLSDESEYSFPSPSAEEFGSYPRMRIDHVFSNFSALKVKSQIIPLSGSDHFPVHTTITP